MLISWYPHIRLHAHFKSLNAQIAIDISFHWTMAAATMFLAFFIFKFLRKVSEYKNKAKFFSRNFWKNDYFHALVIFLIFWFVIFFAVSPQFRGILTCEDEEKERRKERGEESEKPRQSERERERVRIVILFSLESIAKPRKMMVRAIHKQQAR